MINKKPSPTFWDLDWEQLWLVTQESSPWGSFDQSKPSGQSERVDCVTKFWNKRAQEFDKNAKRGRVDDLDLILDQCTIEQGTKVLDIGAGTGRFAVPLAQRGAQVFAIEPASGMLQILQENAKKGGIMANVYTINQKWEEVDINKLSGPFDVVIAPYCLSIMDLPRSLAKIVKISAENIFLFAWITRYNQDYHALWEQIHQRPFHMAPTHIAIQLFLQQMGVFPNVTMSYRQWVTSFNSKEQAIEAMRASLNLENSASDILIRDFVDKHALVAENSVQIPDGGHSAMIWWKRGN